jgi:gliding motility-associated-like protein
MWQGTKAGSSWTYNYREYMQCKLLQPMTAGQRYCVTFYVNNAIATIATHNKFNFVGLDEIGVNFSATKPTQTTGFTMPLQPHISGTPGNFYTDTAAWKKITAIYTAAGGEEWMTIGCFNPSPAPNYLLLHPATPNPSWDYRSYLYFDDFSVVPIVPGDTVKRRFDSLACKKDAFSMTLYAPGEESVRWDDGSTAATRIVNKPGVYWCKARANCQFYVDTTHVVFDPSKVLNLGSDTGNCFGQPLVLKTPAGFSNHLWSNGQTADNITVDTSGVYYVSAKNDCGLQRDTIKVFIQPPTAPPVVSDTTICQFTPNPSLNVTGDNVNWYTHKNGLFGFPHQPVITTSQPGVYTFYVTSTIGKCESEKLPMSIRVRYTPHKALPDVAKMCERYPDSIGEYYPDVTYKWSTGEMACCITPRYEGLYRLATTNECGTYIDSMSVEFSACDTCIVVPNAFTPNRDGSNDQFKAIITCPVKDFHMMVFNRWGNRVFSSNNPNEGWYGYYKNLPCDQGVYIYVIQYHSAATGNPRILKGNVTLVK